MARKAGSGQRYGTHRGRRVRLPNPSECPRARKPAHKITDRARRYRANQPACRPQGPRRCVFCKSRRNVLVHHFDGREVNGAKSNLGWACKSCNAAIAAAFRDRGLGTRTRQFNPKRRRGSPVGFSQYAWAVGMICRHSDQARGLCSPSSDPLVLDAVKIIRETPAAKRREFAARAAASRGRRSEVPF